MKLRKNAFFYFAVLVFLLCMLFSMACVFNRLGAGQEYPYLLKGAWVLGMLALTMALLGACALWARLDMRGRLQRFPGLTRAAEYLLAALLLLAGAFLRFQVIRTIPMEPDSDYKTYYEMAVLLRRGTLVEAGVGYCDYVSMFPHVFGYPWVLAWVLGIFGESVYTALMFNLVLEVGICLVVWRLARLLGGRLCGLVALTAVTFLPSTILYSNFTASEPLFTFVLLLGALLFTLSMKDSPRQERHPWLCAMELTAMAAVLAFGSFIRPMAVIFLIAAVICLLPARKKLAALPRNDIPLGLRLTDRGIKRCALVCAVYFGVSSIFTMATGYAVNRQLAGSASYGYNLLVGLNLQSYGGWNPEDANYLYDALEATGSAQEAQLMCRDMALERLKADPRALLDLFAHKFEVLWGNDDFGASWNILFLDQQGNLTPERESFLYRMMDVSDLYYLVLLFAAAVYGCVCLRRGPDPMYACLLLFCGTAALHLLVENQNRYHYHALSLLCLMSGMTVRDVAQLVQRAVMDRLERKRQEAAEKAARESHVMMVQKEQEDRARLRAEALHAQFDMGTAIREGHIRIVASEGVAMSDLVPPSGDMQEQPAPSRENDIRNQPEAEQPEIVQKQAESEQPEVIQEQEESEQPDDIQEQEESEQPDDIQEQEEFEQPEDVQEQEEFEQPEDNIQEQEEFQQPDDMQEQEEYELPDGMQEPPVSPPLYGWPDQFPADAAAPDSAEKAPLKKGKKDKDKKKKDKKEKDKKAKDKKDKKSKDKKNKDGKKDKKKKK